MMTKTPRQLMLTSDQISINLLLKRLKKCLVLVLSFRINKRSYPITQSKRFSLKMGQNITVRSTVIMKEMVMEFWSKMGKSMKGDLT